MAEEDNKNNCKSQRQTKSDKWEQLKRGATGNRNTKHTGCQ